MKAWLVAAMLAAATTGTRAQAPGIDDETKMQRCRQNTSDLIWLDREQVRARCGIWSSSTAVKSKNGVVERLVYSRYFVVTLRNGVVSSVRQRRQIFTGFKKHSGAQ